jgi:hypothetical protein
VVVQARSSTVPCKAVETSRDENELRIEAAQGGQEVAAERSAEAGAALQRRAACQPRTLLLPLHRHLLLLLLPSLLLQLPLPRLLVNVAEDGCALLPRLLPLQLPPLPLRDTVLVSVSLPRRRRADANADIVVPDNVCVRNLTRVEEPSATAPATAVTTAVAPAPPAAAATTAAVAVAAAAAIAAAAGITTTAAAAAAAAAAVATVPAVQMNRPEERIRVPAQ